LAQSIKRWQNIHLCFGTFNDSIKLSEIFGANYSSGLSFASIGAGEMNVKQNHRAQFLIVGVSEQEILFIMWNELQYTQHIPVEYGSSYHFHHNILAVQRKNCV
jgi:hypothetical protein